MARKSVFGYAQGLFASGSDIYVNVQGTWFFSNSPMATAILAVAADAKRAGTPVLLSYEDSNDSIYYIQSL